MDRLTTNKDVSEMNMVELAHNSCYVKDHNAIFRSYDSDIDARNLARKLIRDIAKCNDDLSDNDYFDEWISDFLSDGTDSIEGLIAVFYRNLWAMAELRERLKEYEDMEESGNLIKLPCAAGDTVYVIPSKANYGINIVNRHEERNRVYEQVVDRIEMFRSGYLLVTCGGMSSVIEQFYKETWFLTKEEAEAALQKMNDNKC